MKVCLINLGCSKNLVDAEVMLGVLKTAGFILTDDPAKADIGIVNTCAFIESAKKEAIDTILELAKFKTNGKLKKLIVAGCLSGRYKEELADLLKEADAFIGPGSVNKIADIAKLAIDGLRPQDVDKQHYLNFSKTPRVLLTPKHYAYVKIADGCDNRCSYCVIPYIRGGYESRSMTSIVKEVKVLTDKGVREINLISQDGLFIFNRLVY